jgi:hypothetical protein
VITMWTRLQPDYASNMWNEALNKRLGTEVIKVSSGLPSSRSSTDSGFWLFYDRRSANAWDIVYGDVGSLIAATLLCRVGQCIYHRHVFIKF